MSYRQPSRSTTTTVGLMALKLYINKMENNVPSPTWEFLEKTQAINCPMTTFELKDKPRFVL